MGLQVLQRMAPAKRHKAAVLATLLSGALLAAGCSRDQEESVPVACKEGAGGLRAALARAPERVELDGTALSDCLARGAEGGDVQQVGAAFVAEAARLAGAARTEPDGPDALRLGYLVGAARRGAAETQGIFDELIRRLDQELTGINTSTGSYRRGYEAGRSRG